jgi:hypothetical protein
MNEAELDPLARLRRSYHRAQFGRAACGFLLVAPIVAWAIYYALLVRTAHGPDSGFAQLGTIFYGLIAAPLLLFPLIGFVAFSVRCGSIARRLPFIDPAKLPVTHHGNNPDATGNA